MAVVIRLARAGAKKKPYYHVVATDSRNPRDGKFIEAIGAYDPNLEPPKIESQQERLEHWLKAGATPSATVAGLIKRASKPTPKGYGWKSCCCPWPGDWCTDRTRSSCGASRQTAARCSS